jgi:sortase B
VLYGHNWTNLREPVAVGPNNNHIMFGQLPSYTNIEFARDNPHIYFSTDKLEGIWRVFCVAYVELSNEFNYNNPNPTDEKWLQLFDELKKRSLHNFDVDLIQSDRLLTLSTCTRQYNAGPQQRYIVVARLLRDGETENDAVNIVPNPSPKKPAW